MCMVCGMCVYNFIQRERTGSMTIPFENSAFYLLTQFPFRMIRSHSQLKLYRCPLCCCVRCAAATYALNIMCIAQALIVCSSLYQYVVNVQIETKTSRHANMFGVFYGSIISHVMARVYQEFLHFICFFSRKEKPLALR